MLELVTHGDSFHENGTFSELHSAGDQLASVEDGRQLGKDLLESSLGLQKCYRQLQVSLESARAPGEASAFNKPTRWLPQC